MELDRDWRSVLIAKRCGILIAFMLKCAAAAAYTVQCTKPSMKALKWHCGCDHSRRVIHMCSCTYGFFLWLSCMMQLHTSEGRTKEFLSATNQRTKWRKVCGSSKERSTPAWNNGPNVDTNLQKAQQQCNVNVHGFKLKWHTERKCSIFLTVCMLQLSKL